MPLNTDRIRRVVSEQLVPELQDSVPVRTGTLRGSIRSVNGNVHSIEYGEDFIKEALPNVNLDKQPVLDELKRQIDGKLNNA